MPFSLSGVQTYFFSCNYFLTRDSRHRDQLIQYRKRSRAHCRLPLNITSAILLRSNREDREAQIHRPQIRPQT
jgi:hypothetical protein